MPDPPAHPPQPDGATRGRVASGDNSRPSFWRKRGPVFVIAIAAAAIGYSLRDHRVERGKTALAEIQRLDGKALAAHTALFARFDAGELSDQDVATGLDKDILPLWTAAEVQLEILRAEDVRGELFEMLGDYVHARRTASELLIRAIRDQDSVRQKESREVWQEADALAAKLKAVGQPPADGQTAGAR